MADHDINPACTIFNGPILCLLSTPDKLSKRSFAKLTTICSDSAQTKVEKNMPMLILAARVTNAVPNKMGPMEASKVLGRMASHQELSCDLN
jgi:hypothetical protein